MKTYNRDGQQINKKYSTLWETRKIQTFNNAYNNDKVINNNK